MELLCLEKATEPYVQLVDDPVFTNDKRVLQNLYFLEKQYLPKFAYFKCVQTEITPDMRKIIAEWLLEVCEAEQLQEDVFPSAMNILDRFLCLVDIHKYQLQLLSCVCLLLACKLRKIEFLTIDKLVTYTDHSVTANEILAWELFVLNTLEWDILAVTPNDFLDLIMPRLSKYKQKQTLIRKHAQIFISLCIIDYKFAFYRPSLIAIASVRTALDGLFNRSRPVLEQIQNKCTTTDLFLSIEKTIFCKQNYKSKLNEISLMIEESCFRANKLNNQPSILDKNNNQIDKNNNQINHQNVQNNQVNNQINIQKNSQINQQTNQINQSKPDQLNSATKIHNNNQKRVANNQKVSNQKKLTKNQKTKNQNRNKTNNTTSNKKVDSSHDRKDFV